ncbi:MAG: hypothetical protein Q4P17_00990 [Methanobacterium sp.]|nr:hypothetical protein [Methanobacterium sp.]
MQLKVEIIDYGYSDGQKKHYITYKVSKLNGSDLNRLSELLKDPVTVEEDELIMNVYFEEGYYPFGTEDSQKRMEDYLAREEIEMTVYILDLLEGQ